MVDSFNPKNSYAALELAAPDSLSSIAAERWTIEQLLEIGTALSDCLDRHELLDLILRKSREITCSDAGSIYTIDRTGDVPKLIFQAAQTHSRPQAAFKSIALPINPQSLAGYVAITGESLNIADAYAIPEELPYRFDPHFDRDYGYRTVSVLVIPMQNREGETIGVLQLIDRKLKADLIVTPENALSITQPYSAWEQQLVHSLASQAAISIERERLIENIESLFDGFVTASVQAIESRDPTTAGHSERVARLSVRLCEEVNDLRSGKLAGIYFTDRQLQELRYASLLHDFGKIGIPEQIVQKERKLYPHQLQAIRHRFDLLQRTWQLACAEQKFAYLLNPPLLVRHKPGDDCDRCRYLQQLDLDLQAKLDRLQAYWDLITKLNRPNVVISTEFAQSLDEVIADLQQLSQYTYIDIDGNFQPLLTTVEIEQLLIPRGSLTPEERSIIESHVSYTYNFLRRIPWTKHLQNVPKIAGAHHEKLDGSGYPHGLTADEIPIQSQIMTIADIYDALTASDRPYKSRVPLDRTFEILHREASAGKIDSDLLALFQQREIYTILQT